MCRLILYLNFAIDFLIIFYSSVISLHVSGGRDISAANAMSHVFGYTIANDVTARDLQKKHLQWFKGLLNHHMFYLKFPF